MALGRDLRRISIHAPQWGATRYDGSGGRPRHFNPRTPVGCDVAQMVENGATVKISIHAPQWGATNRRDQYPISWTISIHAPQWGATRHERTEERRSIISIHAPQWGATAGGGGDELAALISIHAPQWGATGEALVGGEPVDISIHAPQWGATFAALIMRPALVFQSTHPSGVRQAPATCSSCRMRNFNPRTPVGCDA